MSDQGSPVDDKREKSEERLTADHQSVSAKEPLLLQARCPKDKRKSGYPRRRSWVNQQGSPRKLNQSNGKNNA